MSGLLGFRGWWEGAPEALPQHFSVGVCRVEVFPERVEDALVLLILRIELVDAGIHLKEVGVAPHPAAVLGRRCASGIDELYPRGIGRGAGGLLDGDLVGPVVAEVVDVGEGGAFAKAEATEEGVEGVIDFFRLCLAGTRAPGAEVVSEVGTVGSLTDFELPQVTTVPVEGELEDVVEVVEREVVPDAEAPPDGLGGIREFGVERELLDGHGGVSYYLPPVATPDDELDQRLQNELLRARLEEQLGMTSGMTHPDMTPAEEGAYLRRIESLEAGGPAAYVPISTLLPAKVKKRAATLAKKRKYDRAIGEILAGLLHAGVMTDDDPRPLPPSAYYRWLINDLFRHTIPKPPGPNDPEAYTGGQRHVIGVMYAQVMARQEREARRN